MTSFINITNLVKKYRNAEENAVDDLSLNINEREIFGLLGPNGAGKTTTLSILCNQINADSGKVIIDEKTLGEHSNGLKKIIGVVPQDIALYPKLTAFENLKFFGNMYGIGGSLLDERINESASAFGLTHKLNKQVATFSGGMKRRINLIAGLLHQPKVLFLDEPTVGIDVQSKKVIIEYLHVLNKEKGTTIIYTSHLMEEAEKFCSHVAIIDMGKIIEEGKPDELIKSYPTCDNLEDIFLMLTGRSLRD